jgi:hypothetical protein
LNIHLPCFHAKTIHPAVKAVQQAPIIAMIVDGAHSEGAAAGAVTVAAAAVMVTVAMVAAGQQPQYLSFHAFIFTFFLHLEVLGNSRSFIYYSAIRSFLTISSFHG